jgi:hypothetical protein
MCKKSITETSEMKGIWKRERTVNTGAEGTDWNFPGNLHIYLCRNHGLLLFYNFTCYLLQTTVNLNRFKPGGYYMYHPL